MTEHLCGFLNGHGVDEFRNGIDTLYPSHRSTRRENLDIKMDIHSKLEFLMAF